MIYTIGRNYDKYFEELETVEKAQGGSVWKTKEEAKNQADFNNNYFEGIYKVYGVDADWEKDTCESIYDGSVLKGATWRSLTRPATIIKL